MVPESQDGEDALAEQSAPERLLLRKLTGLAPFVVLDTLDAQVGQSPTRLELFESRLDDEGMHPLVRETVGASRLPAVERLNLLRQHPAELGQRGLAALGWSFEQSPQGAEARTAFLALFQPLTEPSTDVAFIGDALDKGLAFALEGLDPFEPSALDDFPEELLEPLSHGLIAAFLFVSAADGEITEEEVAAFRAGLKHYQSPLLFELNRSASPLMERELQRLLSDPPFIEEALRALTRAFNELKGGSRARKELLKVLVKVAKADGTYDANERLMIETLSTMFKGDTRPPNLLDALPAEERDTLALGPIAAFLYVAGADGQPDVAEIQTFMQLYLNTRNPLLQAVATCSTTDAETRLSKVFADSSLIEASLHALGKLFTDRPDGDMAREELLGILVLVAEADGVYDEAEAEMLAKLRQIFHGRPPAPPKASSGGYWMVGMLLAGTCVVMLGMLLLFAYAIFG